MKYWVIMTMGLRWARMGLGVFLVAALFRTVSAQIGGSGWVSLPLDFKVQWPYNVPQDTRYSFTNGIYHCEVRRGDAPFIAGNRTRPRTEQRFPDYTVGEVQFQARLKAPSADDSYCMFQIHTGNAQSHAYGATTLMLFWFSRDGGSLHMYNGRELARDLGGKWFQLNVDHNLATRRINVWINRKLVWSHRDNGAGDFYMKDGVYQQGRNPSSRMDTYITDLHIWTRSASPTTSAADGESNDR